MSVRRPALLLTAVCAGVLVAPQAAVAASSTALSTVQCGATLTADTTLQRHLTCTGDGLVLEPGVTLDLGGYTLRGAGGGVGLLVSSVGEIEVRNGTVTGWATGIDTLGVDDETLDTGPLTVDQVRFQDNAVGVDASGEEWVGRYAKPTTITGSRFVRHSADAVRGDWNASTTVVGTTFTDNRTALTNGGDGSVTTSRFFRNGTALLVGDGVATVTDSVFEHNPRAISSYGSASLTVTGSRFAWSDVALDASAYLDLASSTFVSNDRAVLLGWMGGTVTGNLLRSNGEAIATEESGIGETTIQGNTLRQNGQGIVLPAESDGDFRLGGNDVQGSAGWGINVPGATDLGGNKARGNGSSPQCVGVVCTAN